jgi:hypothetical protein
MSKGKGDRGGGSGGKIRKEGRINESDRGSPKPGAGEIRQQVPKIDPIKGNGGKRGGSKGGA